jgi:hypothetical protein
MEQVSLFVVAAAIGQHRVRDGVDAAADPRDEVICLRCNAESPAAVETPIVLQCCDAVSKDLGGNHAAGSEWVTVQA